MITFIHDDMIFAYSQETLKSHNSLVGFYFDAQNIVQQISRNSLYGSIILNHSKLKENKEEQIQCGSCHGTNFTQCKPTCM